jgi:hypothetical protein
LITTFGHNISQGVLIQNVELPIAKARSENGEIEVEPVILYPMNLKRDCKFLSQLNPLPEWGKTWQDLVATHDPVYQKDKMNYSVRCPLQYWKVCVLVRDDGVRAGVPLHPADKPPDDLTRD